MSAAKHTPGPWVVGVSDAATREAHLARVAQRLLAGNRDVFPLVWAPEHPETRVGVDPGRPEHAVVICDMGNGPAGEANAALIAAAPDLLSACEEMDRLCSGPTLHLKPDGPVRSMLRAAIAKAGGGR